MRQLENQLTVMALHLAVTEGIMRLKSLSLRGFKSFAGRTILKFEPGITAIVGPNGSGKSNITDAVLWVLGEQRARTLRGASMEDVIFAGSASQPSLGVAEVSLALDNTDGGIPIDFAEVVITRRLYRSGESDYRINNSPVRLLDIQELMSDSGIGREMYSVISQGRLDEILNCRPEERRVLIEEAAGILKHRKRKERALRRLQSMDDHLTRAKDVLSEVNRQLNPLRKQAETARLYADLRSELNRLEVEVAVAELREYQASWQASVDEEKLAVEQAEKSGVLLEQERQRSRELQEILDAGGNERSACHERRGVVKSLGERLNAGLLLLEEKGKNLVDKASGLRRRLFDLNQKNDRLRGSIDDLGNELRQLESELAASQAELGDTAGTPVGETGLCDDDSVSGLERDVAALRKVLDDATASYQETELKLSSSLQESEYLEKRLDVLRNALVDQQGLLDTKAGLRDEARHEEGRQSKELDEVRSAMAAIASASTEAVSQRERAAELLAGESAAIAALESVIESRQDAGAVQKLADAAAPRRTRGLLKSMLSVQTGYEAALDAALGTAVEALVLEDIAAAALILGEVEQAGLRAEMVAPLRPAAVAEQSRSLPSAASFVQCEPAVRDIVDQLLGTVFVAESIGEGLRVLPDLAPHEAIVTKAGDVINGNGHIRWSARGSSESGPLLLAASLAASKARQGDLVAELEAAQARESKLARKRVAVAEKLERLAAECSESSMAVVRLADEIASIERQTEVIAAERAGLEDRLANVRLETIEITRDSEIRRDAARSLAQELAVLERNFANARESQKNLLREQKETAVLTSGLKERIASLSEKSRTVARMRERAEEELQTGLKQKDIEERSLLGIERMRSRLQPLHDVYADMYEVARRWDGVLGAELESRLLREREQREHLRVSQQTMTELAEKLQSHREDISSAEVRRARLEVQVNGLVARLVDELDVPVEKALQATSKDVELSSSRRALKDIRARLAGIGPYNPLACEQFAELEERSKFLTSQIDDLASGRMALRKLVAAIEDKMRGRFQECLEELNEHFQKTFSLLFPGGRAALVLVDEENPMESGIEIEAQPEGKKLQSLALLSGGEKALVGLALLFAICYTRPSPFYVLDEVDAPLDDINIGRLTSLLHSLERETQIVVVTHQRSTMETARSVYGVSMQANGISKLVSQKLENTEDIEEANGGGLQQHLAGTATHRSK